MAVEVDEKRGEKGESSIPRFSVIFPNTWGSLEERGREIEAKIKLGMKKNMI